MTNTAWQCELRQPWRRGTPIREKVMKVWKCMGCGFVYYEEAGLPDEGIAPGTAWADIPEDWTCPDCGAAKRDFEMVEIT